MKGEGGTGCCAVWDGRSACSSASSLAATRLRESNRVRSPQPHSADSDAHLLLFFRNSAALTLVLCLAVHKIGDRATLPDRNVHIQAVAFDNTGGNI